MSMFCYQCQETAGNTGCTIRGVCGKTEEVAKLQDLLIYTLKGVALLLKKTAAAPSGSLSREILNSLFITITNANFDDAAIERQIKKMLAFRDGLKTAGYKAGHDAETFSVSGRADMLEKAASVGVLATEDADIRSLIQMITYGLKGMAAYAEHALNITKIADSEIVAFIVDTLAALTDAGQTAQSLVALVLKTGEYGVKAMAALDAANTQKYGNPEITEVAIGVRENPAILISGHDLCDLEQLLEQTKDAGVDVYTHGEMLPAHYYPYFKKYKNLVGNYGGAWWKQLSEFETFKGTILFTTNCIVPPRSEEVRARIFTTNSAGYPSCKHIEPDENGKKDFSELIALAKTLPPPREIESGSIIGGFAHNQVSALKGKIAEAVKSGAIKKFFVMGGCDGRMRTREYYAEFAKKLAADTVILTAGCAKYRYNKLGLGEIGGIPRVLDAGQCNDSYSLVLIALELKELFGLDDVNKLPIVYNIAWYEQKAVIVLLALLYLGVKNIHLGPTLPGFLSPNVAKVLVEKFGIAGIGTPDADLAAFLES
ncbi:MAG TPA: hydroxylamine reductase [Eubacteriales bacterium]|nr:hydroxylamine reductase [Eubacteriales bacterium]